MKEIKLTLENLIKKIDNYKTESEAGIVYLDIVDKEMFEREPSIISAKDKGFYLGDNVVFIRDTPIIVYKKMLEYIRKNINEGQKVNKLLPKALVDFNTDTQYYTDFEPTEENIKDIKI